jgi:putative ABC transport system permease protein
MEIRAVTPGYFNALHLKITAGRALTAADTAAGDPVMLVNETVARRWWPHDSPLGDHVVIGRFRGAPFGDNHDPMRTVVGVVADAKSVTLAARPRPTVYFPSSQAPWVNSGTAWAVRGPGVAALADTVRRAIADFDPHQRVDGIRAMTDIIASTTAAPRFSAWLSGAFAIVALTLTAIGVYGLLAFSVARRTSEIGLRRALGAPPSRILRAVVGEGVSLILIGLAFGLAGAVAISRMLASLLFGITATDGVSFAVVAGLLLVVGLVASAIPAFRASRIDPLEALRVD